MTYTKRQSSKANDGSFDTLSEFSPDNLLLRTLVFQFIVSHPFFEASAGKTDKERERKHKTTIRMSLLTFKGGEGLGSKNNYGTVYAAAFAASCRRLLSTTHMDNDEDNSVHTT